MSIRKEQKKGSSILYLIDEENRTVVAKVPTQSMYMNVMSDCQKCKIAYYPIIEVMENDPRSYFVGTAKCAPTDTFDVEVGKRLARDRALEKFYLGMVRCFKAIAEELDKDLEKAEDYLNYAWLSANRFHEEGLSIVDGNFEN